MTEKLQKAGTRATKRPQEERDEHGLILDEHFILDACIFGATVHEIANVTGISPSRIKRLLRSLYEKKLVESNVYPNGRGTRTTWTRIGPED